MPAWIDVWVHAPRYSSLSQVLTYRHTSEVEAGTLVKVPMGKRSVAGLVIDIKAEPPQGIEPHLIKPIEAVLTGIPPLTLEWRRLVEFAARYYQRAQGEVALSALPPDLRTLSSDQLARRLKKLAAPPDATTQSKGANHAPVLTAEQQQALKAIEGACQPVLLFGPTGSGKTEIYLHAAQTCLERDPLAQVLVMVPEINLTPQLIEQFESRFGADSVCAMHSGLTPAKRLQHWLKAHLGTCRILLGTRMAVFASLPHLQLIIVDEEHDPSYKSQEGSRFSARDLAVYRGHHATKPCHVILGSATPSLESWNAALNERYLLVKLTQRIGNASLPRLRLVDMQRQPKQALLAPSLLEAIQLRASRGQQSLLLLNRRGFAPVLACAGCGWKSQCPHCSVYQVFHKRDRSLRCHHCGFKQPVPVACPTCGELDIEPIGKGTEQLEEHLSDVLSNHTAPSGLALKVARLDADTARTPEALEQQLAAMHAGEVDVLVGTQMVAKGHDFRRITLVAAINPDGALYASDFRAPERLFSLLVQAGGRSGRDQKLSQDAELWVQTWVPEHPLFKALRDHDYAGFAAQELQVRQAALLPPFVSQALVRAEAKTQFAAQGFLNAAALTMAASAAAAGVTAFPAVPMPTARVANVERAQWLLESENRVALQRLLPLVQDALRSHAREHQIIRWAIDVDPLSI